ncbi:MAG: A/G-specific adenine glycosylase [Chloroflexota bacterium]
MSSTLERVRYTRKWLNTLHNHLLVWFAQNGRSFPWRQTSDPFLILLAEKLLQQTAARPSVVRAYETIFAIYPTPESLAGADLSFLYSVVAPLGLPVRALELINCARAICENHSGNVPDDLDALRALPGVGEYIARSVLCFAFDMPIAVVDTNIARWLFRIHYIKDELPSNPARHRKLIELAQAHLPDDNAKAWNWAILDLCAAICIARAPNCFDCPLNRSCKYGKRRVRVLATGKRPSENQ